MLGIDYPRIPAPICPILDPGDKVAVVGDWHGDLSRARWALKGLSAQGVTTVVHVGDFMFLYDGPYTSNIKLLDGIASDNGIKILFIDGNHDDHIFLKSSDPATGFAAITENLIHIRRSTVWTWRGKTWAAIGGAGSIDKEYRNEGVSWWPEENITEDQIMMLLDTLDGNSPDIVISHEMPSYAPLVVPKLSFGDEIDKHIAISKELLGRIPHPKVWAYGHYHVRATAYAPGIETRFETVADNGSVIWDNIMLLDTGSLEEVEFL